MNKYVKGLYAHQATGAAVLLPHFMGLLASALCKAQCNLPKGSVSCKEALAVAHRNGERCYEAELYRLKGPKLLTGGSNRSSCPANGVRWKDHCRCYKFIGYRRRD